MDAERSSARPLHRRDADRQSGRPQPARGRNPAPRRPDPGRGQEGHAQSCWPMSAPRRRWPNYHDHTSEAEREAIVGAAGERGDRAGQRCGNAADLRSRLQAGSCRARRRPCHLTPSPGPRAAIAALTLAGLPTDRFLFAGFLPAEGEGAERCDRRTGGSVRATLVFYESGPRLGDSACRASPRARRRAMRRWSAKSASCTRKASLARLAELAARYAEAPPKGEIVIVVGPPAERAEASDEDLGRRARRGAEEPVPVARRRRRRRALNVPAQARLRPRARTLEA